MPVWLNIILAFVGGTGLMGLITTAIWNKQKARFEKIKNLEESAEKTEVRDIIKEEVKPILDLLDTLNTKLEANSEGTVTLLRDRMKHTLDECKKAGYASTSEKANWNELYSSYKKLGGNHFREYVDEWKKEMNQLPHQKGE